MTRRPETYDGVGDAGLRRRARPGDPAPAPWPAATSPTTSCTPWTPPTSSGSTPRRRRAFGQAAAEAGVAADRLPRRPRQGRRRRCRRTCAAAARSRGCSASGGVPVTTLRAGIVIGHEGLSWEMTRQLVERLPLMVTPRWVTHPDAADRRSTTWCATSSACSTCPRRRAGPFEVGGDEVLRYVRHDAPGRGHRGPAAGASSRSRCCRPGCRRTG